MKFGPSFPEFVSLGARPKRAYSEPKTQEARLAFLPLLAILIGFLLLGKLLELQIVQGRYYRELSDSNRIREELIHAPRGIIYDRTGASLVHNVPGFRVVGQDGRVKALEKRAGLLHLTSDASSVRIDSLRQYVDAPVFSHVTGFIGEVSKEELEPAYKPGDFVGKVGIERMYETILRGVDGRQLYEVDSQGRQVRQLGRVGPKPGRDITLAIDKELSKAAFSAMEGVEKGAFIASVPQTGEILVLISKPSFDANLFTLGEDHKTSSDSAYQSVDAILSDDKNRPLFNRAISGTYPPGSTFKIVTAASGLATGKIDERTEIEDIGIIRIGNFSFPNWYFTQYGKLEGNLDIIRAIARSNDIFFYKVAELVGLPNLEKMAKLFGLSEKLGIDLPEEATGLFPSDSWKRETIGDQWYLGDTYHVGIGQGYILTTPLQVNAWTSVIANGGTLYQPRLIKNTTNTTNTTNNPIRKDFLSKKTIELIKEGMRGACSPGGTGWPLFKFKVKNEKLKVDEKNFFKPDDTSEDGWVHIPVACKTGTAEYGDPKDRTHAWFTVFAPVEDPEIVVTVLVEGGGEGSNVAAPIAKKVLEEWFRR